LTGVDVTGRVTAIVVAWRTRDLVDQCLRSLAASAPSVPAIVVDNGSADGTAEMVRRDWPGVRLIANEVNVGYTRANNQGMELASTEHLLLLNADSMMTPGCLEALLHRMDADPRAGIVAPRLEYGNGRWQRWTAGAAPSVLSSAAYFLFFERLLPRRLGQRSVYLQRDVRQAFQPDWVCAAGVLVRRSAMADIGGFDERIFAYMDDVDLCRRARQAGWNVWYEPAAQGVHLMGQSSLGEPGGVSPLALTSYNRYVAAHCGGAAALAVRVCEVVGFATRAAVYAGRAALTRRETWHGRKARAHLTHLKLSFERSPLP